MRSRRLLESQKKIDSTNNGDASRGCKRLEKEKNYLPLHIKRGLVILVPREKCNEKYRQEYLKKISGVREDDLVGTASRRFDLINELTYDKLSETKDLSLKDAAKALGVARETVAKYRKEVLGE